MQVLSPWDALGSWFFRRGDRREAQGRPPEASPPPHPRSATSGTEKPQLTGSVEDPRPGERKGCLSSRSPKRDGPSPPSLARASEQLPAKPRGRSTVRLWVRPCLARQTGPALVAHLCASARPRTTETGGTTLLERPSTSSAVWETLGWRQESLMLEPGTRSGCFLESRLSTQGSRKFSIAPQSCGQQLAAGKVLGPDGFLRRRDSLTFPLLIGRELRLQFRSLTGRPRLLGGEVYCTDWL
ncbi:uncharacterized protein ACBT57_025698 [Dama dama]